GSLFGSHASKPGSGAPPPPPASAPAPSGPWQTAPPAYAPGPPMGAPGGGASSFLRSAATTAAGVAAGALAFQGIESLMHGFGHAAGYGQDFGGFGGVGQRPVEEVVNNYYGDTGGEHGGHAVSADERALGQQEDRDFGSLDSKGDSDRDSLYGSRDDVGSGLSDT